MVWGLICPSHAEPLKAPQTKFKTLPSLKPTRNFEVDWLPFAQAHQPLRWPPSSKAALHQPPNFFFSHCSANHFCILSLCLSCRRGLSPPLLHRCHAANVRCPSPKPLCHDGCPPPGFAEAERPAWWAAMPIRRPSPTEARERSGFRV